MRLWSINPKYLDRAGLLGLWREALLAQKVLLGETRGYRNHPQLVRFKMTEDPALYIGTYLYYVYLEGVSRGYRFSKEKIIRYSPDIRIPVRRGQLEYEFRHLLRKLEKRSPEKYLEIKDEKTVEPHPLFYVIEGGVEDWEKIKP